MNLAAIEAQLLEHAQTERRRWQQMAQLLMRVDTEQLWEGHAQSFTAWVQGIARRADMQESVFWRYLKAGRIYQELTGATELTDDVTVSAESLELADKIRRHAPKAVTSQVLERTLEGDLSRTQLREVWATYRPAAGGTTARGRLPEDPDARVEAMAVRQAAWEAQKRKPENRAEVRRAEIILGFRSGSFLGAFDQAHAEARMQLAKQMAAVLVVRRSAEQPDRVELHGLWTCVSQPELSDFEYQGAPGTDYMWLGVPTELADDAAAKAPRMAGVLAFTRERAVRVVREAQRRPIGAEGRIAMLTALLQRSYVWP